MPSSDNSLGTSLQKVMEKTSRIPQAGRSRGLLEVDLSLLIPNPKNPRKQFREQELSELADSIREHGIVQPIVVARRWKRLSNHCW